MVNDRDTEITLDEIDNRRPFCPDAKDTWRTGSRMGDESQSPSDRAQPYADLVTDLLAMENSLVNRLETRAVAVITTSAALVTLLLGLASLVTRNQGLQISRVALTLAALAAVAFLVAALAAMWVNRPRKAWSSRPEGLAVELWERWSPPESYDPLKKATATRIALWDATRKLTQQKAVSLFVAQAAQATAVVLLGIATLIVLL